MCKHSGYYLSSLFSWSDVNFGGKCINLYFLSIGRLIQIEVAFGVNYRSL
jgi:hypothetical protein